MKPTKNYFTRAVCLLLLLTTLFFSPHGMAQNPASNPVSQIVLPKELHLFSFIWEGDSARGSWEPHSAMIVPVSLPGCPKQFYMQFDLGSNISMFYGPILQTIRGKYPNAIKTGESTLTDVSFNIGDMSVFAREINVRQFGSGAINWKDNSEKVIIGTIGLDMFDARYLVIDYPGKKIATAGKMPGKITQNMQYADLINAGGKILLPATLRGKKQLLYFDTGSSAFTLITDKTTSEQLAIPGRQPASYNINSWGKALPIFTLPTADSIVIASQKLALRETSYVENTNGSMVQQMMRMGITGLTGNKLFLQSVILLDLENKKFGIRPSIPKP